MQNAKKKVGGLFSQAGSNPNTSISSSLIEFLQSLIADGLDILVVEPNCCPLEIRKRIFEIFQELEPHLF